MRNITEAEKVSTSHTPCASQLTRHAVGDLGVRRTPGEQLDDRARKRPDVGLGRRALELDNLGRHPIGCARHVLHFALHGAEVEGDTKVGQLYVAVLGREDIRSLQIAVYDITLVKVVQTFEDLDDVACHKFLVKLAERFQGLP